MACTAFAAIYEAMRQAYFENTTIVLTKLSTLIERWGLMYPSMDAPPPIEEEDSGNVENAVADQQESDESILERLQNVTLSENEGHPFNESRNIDAIQVVRKSLQQMRAAKRVKLNDHNYSVSEAAAAPRVMHPLRSEMDNHADTTCCGSNFRPLIFTGQNCDVKGFHHKLTTMSDVPVATCATAYTDPETNIVYIFIFNEALYFGDEMDHSLVNPNQNRHYGIDVEDNPYRKMGISCEESGDSLHIPFHSEGTTILPHRQRA